MAYGMGRPAILREDEAIHNCRRLLEHPLSITSDARLVSTVELTALRGASAESNVDEADSSSIAHRAHRFARSTSHGQHAEASQAGESRFRRMGTVLGPNPM